MLINQIEGIFSQYVQTSNHHNTHFKYRTILCVSCISTKKKISTFIIWLADENTLHFHTTVRGLIKKRDARNWETKMKRVITGRETETGKKKRLEYGRQQEWKKVGKEESKN